jgi:hypothetical protein
MLGFFIGLIFCGVVQFGLWGISTYVDPTPDGHPKAVEARAIESTLFGFGLIFIVLGVLGLAVRGLFA